MTNKEKAIKMLEELRDNGSPDSSILEEVIYSWMSGDDAVEFLESYASERDIKLS